MKIYEYSYQINDLRQREYSKLGEGVSKQRKCHRIAIINKGVFILALEELHLI